MLGEILGAAISGAANYGLSVYNNQAAAERAAQDRQENYMYGEMAANNADARTRALYNDFYSPEALMQQYKASGMSPSMLLGGTPGQGGISGAHGSGASGIQTPYMPMSLVDTAQAAALFAQAEKTQKEAEQVEPFTESEIAKNLADAGHQEAAKALLTAQKAWQDLQNEIGNETKEANIYQICELADKAGYEASREYYSMRSAKVLADIDEKTYQTEVDKRIAVLNNIISSTAKNNKEIEQVIQDMKHQIYEWDLGYRQLEVQEQQQKSYAEWIEAQIPKIEKELELKAEELGVEKKRIWIQAISETLKGIAIGAAAVSQFKGSNATPAGAQQVLKKKHSG